MSTAVSAAPSVSPVSAAIAAYRAAGARGDADAISALLAPDVALHSPLTERVRFAGRDEVTAMHRDIFAVLEELETGEPLARDDTRSFTFCARVRGVELNAMVLAEFNAAATRLGQAPRTGHGRASGTDRPTDRVGGGHRRPPGATVPVGRRD